MKRSKPGNVSTPSVGAPSPNGRKRPPARSAQPPASERRRLSLKPVAGREHPSALRDVQKRFAAVVTRPLTPNWTTQPVWIDGRSSQDVVAEFVKPNDRMTSLERIELYNRQYWYRLIDILYEDYPGLAAILGNRKFRAFSEEYLVAHPSRSGLLRNLGTHLSAFITARPELTAPNTDMARDMARFEWAQVEAFDRAEKPPLKPDDLLGKDPATTHLSLQPYLSLLDLSFAVDKLLLSVKKQSLRSETSNATDGLAHMQRRRRLARREKVQLAVHRSENRVYVKRIAPEALAILSSLRDGASIADAVGHALESTADEATDWPAMIQKWFALWMSFGWFWR